MELQACPYCGQPGLVTTVRVHARGLDVSGLCKICGYSVHSDYAPAEAANDLPGEFTQSLEVTAAD